MNERAWQPGDPIRSGADYLASIRGRQEHVRRVDLEVGVGEALLHLGDREIEGKGFIGRELKWAAGIGNAAVEVECGVGEVDVRLDE